MSAEAALIKKAKSSAAHYCAMAERSPRQVADRLKRFKVSQVQLQKVISELTAEGFLDPTRFAKAFCNDKLRFNKWGKNRLKLELINHQISAEVIDEALSNIDAQLYAEELKHVLKKKLKSLSQEDDLLVAKKKLTDHAIRKGFEPTVVFSMTHELLSSSRH